MLLPPAKVGQIRHKPWGKVRTDLASPDCRMPVTDYGFNGQRGVMGLLDYHARFFDASLARFISADSIIPNARMSQSWDRYAYTYNNPLNFTDPTGHFGKHNDDKSDYWNKQNQQKVKGLEEKWEREKAEKSMGALLVASSREFALAQGLPVTGPGFGGAKPLLGPGAVFGAVLPWWGPSGTKLELFITGAFFAGGQWGYSLITTATGDVQLFYEHAKIGTVGPNVSISYTRGPVFGLIYALDYKGRATALAINYEIGTADAWRADEGGVWGFDTGWSLGASVPGPSAADTVAEPLDGWRTNLGGAGLVGCRIIGLCGG